MALCLREGKTFADLTDAEWAQTHPLFATERPALTALESVQARDVLGGTAPRQVAAQLRAAQERITAARRSMNDRKSKREAMMAGPEAEA